MFSGFQERLQRFLSGFQERLQRFFSNPRNRNVTITVVVLLIASVFIRVEVPPVSLAAEPLLEEGSPWLTNSLLTTFIVDIIIILMALFAVVGRKEVPGAWQNLMEMLVEGMWNLTQGVAGHGSERSRKFFPWVMTIFILVLISNYTEVIPGVGSIGLFHSVPQTEPAAVQVADHQVAMAGSESAVAAPVAAEAGEKEFVPLFRPPSADLNMTLALALISVVMTQVYGVRALGLRYFNKFFRNPVKDFMGSVVGFFELISELAKIISFSFRLFGNIFAGDVVLVVMPFLITFLLPVPFYGLEIFVGFIQALVFMLLTLAFFTMATMGHGDH